MPLLLAGSFVPLRPFDQPDGGNSSVTSRQGQVTPLGETDHTRPDAVVQAWGAPRQGEGLPPARPTTIRAFMCGPTAFVEAAGNLTKGPLVSSGYHRAQRTLSAPNEMPSIFPSSSVGCSVINGDGLTRAYRGFSENGYDGVGDGRLVVGLLTQLADERGHSCSGMRSGWCQHTRD
jgi:hypothetical protein